MKLNILFAITAFCFGTQSFAALPVKIMDQLAGAYECPIPNTTFKNKMSVEMRDDKLYMVSFSGDVHRVTDQGLSCDGWDTINATKVEEIDSDGSTKKTTDICTATALSRTTEETPSKSKDKYVNSISITKTAGGVTIVSKITDKDQNGKWISIGPITFACTKAK